MLCIIIMLLCVTFIPVIAVSKWPLLHHLMTPWRRTGIGVQERVRSKTVISTQLKARRSTERPDSRLLTTGNFFIIKRSKIYRNVKNVKTWQEKTSVTSVLCCMHACCLVCYRTISFHLISSHLIHLWTELDRVYCTVEMRRCEQSLGQWA